VYNVKSYAAVETVSLIMSFNVRCALLSCTVLLLGGCSNEFSGNQYAAEGVGEVSRAERGVIISMRKVEIRKDGTPGALLGAAGGGVLGSMIGEGKGRVLATAAGAAAGGLAGHAIQNRSRLGVEYTVRLENGETIVLTQGAEPALSVGQEVYVVDSKRGRGRIVPA
jgi:outer membrane lipoprotein SlyB